MTWRNLPSGAPGFIKPWGKINTNCESYLRWLFRLAWLHSSKTLSSGWSVSTGQTDCSALDARFWERRIFPECLWWAFSRRWIHEIKKQNKKQIHQVKAVEQTDLNARERSRECDSSQDQTGNHFEEGAENKETHLLLLFLLARILIVSEASSPKAPGGEEKLSRI